MEAKIKPHFAYNINGTGETGLVYIEDNTSCVLCLCSRDSAKIILDAFKKASKYDKTIADRTIMDSIHEIAELTITGINNTEVK